MGELIDVKDYGRARVIEPLQTDSSKPHCGRYRVQYIDNQSTYYCRPNAMRKVQPSSKRVVVCETTKEYRAAAVQNTDIEDVCLEVGCHEGITTAIIAARCKAVLGIDKSDVTVKAARAKHPQLSFEVVDGFDIESLKKLSPTGTFSKIFVDIGGICELGVVVALVSLYFTEFKRSMVIVKSVFLKRFLENTEIFRYFNGWVILDQPDTGGS